MAKLILIDSLGWQDGLFNLGLAYLSSSMKLAGHHVRVIDLNNKFRSPEQILAIVGRDKPDYVGFSVKSATFANAVELHRKLAEAFPAITFLYGGPHITLSGTEILDETPPAFFIRGDAEFSLPAFVNLHQKGEQDFRSIDGIVYRGSDGDKVEVPTKFHTKIDDLPLPDFTTFDTFADFKTYPLLTSRGCPYKCTYCSVPAISGSRWVYRSAPSVMKELDYAINFLKMKSVVIVDDNFTLHKKRAESICDAIVESGLKFLWSCGNGIRADRIWPDLAEKMYKAGCVEVAFGIESLDAGVFGQLTKGEELKHIRHGIRIVQEAGINVTGFFMIGLPGSTYRKDLRTLALARKLSLNNYYFGLTVPYPGTELWNWAQKSARFLVPWQNSYHISEVFREGLQRIKVEPVFDTPEYPAEQRKKMFRTVQESKTRLQNRSLKVVRNSLRGAPGRPLILIRSSRRDNIFSLFKDICSGNPHIALYKGNGDFFRNLEAPIRNTYELVHIEGEGFLSAADATNVSIKQLAGGVVVFDVPNGNLTRNENLLEFARALKPRQIVALLGDHFEILPVRSRDAAEAGTSLRLEDPEMEPVYLGIDPSHTAKPAFLEHSLPILQ
jgi:anaerobic magnesium-protoporphyrin IX monomethyl ester cyclase